MDRHEVYLVDTEVLPDGRCAAWVWINGNVPLLLLVDAAAGPTALLREIVRDDLRLAPFMTAIGPSSAPTPARTTKTLYRVAAAELGQSWIEHPLLAIADEVSIRLPSLLAALNVDGVLGMDWLVPRFDRVLFDLRERRLELWQLVR